MSVAWAGSSVRWMVLRLTVISICWGRVSGDLCLKAQGWLVLGVGTALFDPPRAPQGSRAALSEGCPGTLSWKGQDF